VIRPGGESKGSRTNEHAALEAELRDWLGRRADEVTSATVRAREVPLPPAPVARRRVPLRLAVPAAALVLAAAGWALTTTGSDGPTAVTVPPAGPAPAATTPTEPSSAPPTPRPPSPSSVATPSMERPSPIVPPTGVPSADRAATPETPPRNLIRGSPPSTPSRVR
jgi:hypothetical protein